MSSGIAREFALPLDQLADPLAIPTRSAPFDVTLRPPGSKSITNRLYVLAALADGRSTIRRPLRSDDCDRLLTALGVLGANSRWTGTDGEDVEIQGVAGRFPRGGRVDLGDGGTPTRFMLAAACLAAEPVVVDGSPRMRERPVAEGVAMLRSLGADIRFLEHEGRLPVEVRPSDAFRGGELSVGRTASSQFISAALLVAPWLERGVTVHAREPLTSPSYIELTLDVLRPHVVPLLDVPASASAPVSASAPASTHPARTAGGSMHVPGVPGVPDLPEGRGLPGLGDGRGGGAAGGLVAFDRTVEPDASSAMYWLAAAALVPGSIARIPALDLDGPQPDARGARAVAPLGVRASSERTATGMETRFDGALERGGDLDASDWPDGALAIAAMSAAAPAPVTIRGLATLRVKETDRIAALATELRRIGCTVEASDDHLRIDPSTRHDRPVLVTTYDDHRMAMAFAVLGLARPGIAVRDPGCVAKSYPGFWRDLGAVLAAPVRPAPPAE